jgi:hypothetical protein
MNYPQANQEMTVGAMKEMTDHIEKQSRFPFHKRMSTLDGAFRYAKFALATYSNAKATVEPIDEGIWKYRVTVDEVAEHKKEEEHPPWWPNETMDPVEMAQIMLKTACKFDDVDAIAEATADLATAQVAKMLAAEKKPYKGDNDETH